MIVRTFEWGVDMSINWFPGHMHKATKAIKALLPKVDVILEILDARIPYSSENPVIQQLDPDIPRVKLLNKSDLADAEKNLEWLNYYNSLPNTHAKSLSMYQGEKIQMLIPFMESLIPDHGQRVGFINVLVLGIPNVGKSTTINALLGRKVAKTGNEPAITKDIQKLRLGDNIMLWDSPGILWPKVENPNSGYRLAVTGAIKDTAMNHADVAFFAADFLLTAYPDALMKRYHLGSLPDSALVFLEQLGKARGCLGKKGAIDFDRVGKILLTEIRDSNVAPITLETPDVMLVEKEAVEQALKRKEEEKKSNKEARKKAFRLKK